MSPPLGLIVTLLAVLSTALSIAILVCSARSLNTYNDQQPSNVWFLPIWPNHFDVRDLQTLIGTNATLLILNVVLVSTTFVHKLPQGIVQLVVSTLGSAVALVAIVVSNVLNTRAPTTDTLHTWTCEWSNADTVSRIGPPSVFSTICHETRFAFYATIPVFVIQLCLLACAYFTRTAVKREALPEDFAMEKGRGAAGYSRHASWEAQTESVHSEPAENVQVYAQHKQ